MKIIIAFLLFENVVSQTKYPQSSLNITKETSLNITSVSYFVESMTKLVVDEKNWYWKSTASCWKTDSDTDTKSCFKSA